MSINYPSDLIELMNNDTVTLVYRVLATVNCDTSIIPRLDRVSDATNGNKAKEIQAILDEFDNPAVDNSDDDRIL